MHTVNSIDELESLYGTPGHTSLAKVSPKLTPAYQQILQASPFCAVATTGPEGLDCSPRGDASGFIHVLDERTLALPDRRGNNRLDTLRNIVRSGEIALLCLIPGVNETLRINGTAFVTTDPGLLAQLAVKRKLPTSAIIVNIREVYFQCARALVRSGLWLPEAQVERTSLPSAGQMTKSALPDFDAATYDAELPARQRDTLY